MSFKAAAATLASAFLVATQVATAAPQGNGSSNDLPVSISRIREELKKTARLRATSDAKPDFKVEINETQRFQNLLDLLDFGSSGPTIPSVWFGSTTPPLVSVNATGAGLAIRNAVAKARRARAERLAREEVERALNEFCRTHECQR